MLSLPEGENGNYLDLNSVFEGVGAIKADKISPADLAWKNWPARLAAPALACSLPIP